MSHDPRAADVPDEAIEAWCRARYRRGAFDPDGNDTVWGVGARDALSHAIAAFAAAGLAVVAVDDLRRLHGALLAIDADHNPIVMRPSKAPVGCQLCYPGDSSWPCTTRMELDEALDALNALYVRKETNP